uniref:Uncharacterized protein n=1 Tax=Siphoviridae sp. ctdmY20 TaxID=2825586 RepID=A0A8S5QA08_9CAUD|nr:MAG TPA: hypothetical protein [Siphoviridae sp. ctdmY20]
MSSSSYTCYILLRFIFYKVYTKVSSNYRKLFYSVTLVTAIFKFFIICLLLRHYTVIQQYKENNI